MSGLVVRNWGVFAYPVCALVMGALFGVHALWARARGVDIGTVVDDWLRRWQR